MSLPIFFEIFNDEGVVLFIQDTTPVDYGSHNHTTGLGPIGNNQGRGFLLHTALAVIPRQHNPEILGIAMQEAWKRED